MKIETFKKKLLYLKSKGVVALKAGTEVEDMNFEEISIFKKISDKIVPVLVKIGGPEARNDIRECIKNNIDVIVGPMLESEYSFQNFVIAFNELIKNKKMRFSINIETITAVKNLDKIIQNENFKNIYSVVIGRTDLAASIRQDVDSAKVYNLCREIIKKVKSFNPAIPISIGGKIKSINIDKILNELHPDLINTRNIVANSVSLKNELNINELLDFEIEFYELFKEISHYKKELYIKRIEDNKSRQNKN